MVKYCSANCRVLVEPPKNTWEYKGCVGSKYFSKSRRRAYRGHCIDSLVVYMAYDWTCWLCSDRIDPALSNPDPLSATIDHIVPLEQGGEHSYLNIRPAHKICNEERD